MTNIKDIINNFGPNVAEKFSSPGSIVCSVIDIIATFFIVYGVILFLKRNNAMRLFKYLAIVLLASVLIVKLQAFPVLGVLGANVLIILILVVFVLYSDDLKRVVRKLYSPKEDKHTYNLKYECSDDELRFAISDIVKAVQGMSKKNIGALLVIAPDQVPESIVESGTRLDAELSSQLIECVFFNKSPLHDGAVFIRGNKIIAAGCFLPLTQKVDLDKELGTRHRAAIGETEQYSNHLAIIVSEETGVISVAKAGEIVRYYDSAMLYDVLEQAYGLKAGVKNRKKNR